MFILNVVKVLCFDTLLQVFILKVFTPRLFALLGGREGEGHEERATVCGANTEIGVPGLVSGWDANFMGYGNTTAFVLSREIYCC